MELSLNRLGLGRGVLGIVVEVGFTASNGTGEPVITVDGGTITTVVSEPSIYAGTYNTPVSAFDTVNAVSLVDVTVSGAAEVGATWTITPGFWLLEDGTVYAPTYDKLRNGAVVASNVGTTGVYEAGDDGFTVSFRENVGGESVDTAGALITAAVYVDDFEVADRNLAGFQDTGSPGTWIEYFPDGGTTNPGLEISGGVVEPTAIGSVSICARNDTDGVNDLRMTINWRSEDATQNAVCRAAVRFDDVAGHYYMVGYNNVNNEWRIIRRDAGFTPLASYADPFATGQEREVICEVVGSNFTVTIDGVVRMTATDSGVTGTKHGIYGFSNSSSPYPVALDYKFESLD